MSLWDEEPSVVVTFANTPDACAMEDAARTHGIPGRLMPVPAAGSAGCGLAWGAPAGQRDVLVAALAGHAVAHEAVYELENGAARRM